MFEDKFLEEMKDLLETDKELSMDTALDEMEEWDSLAQVSFLSVMSDYASSDIEPKAVRAAATVQELYQLL